MLGDQLFWFQGSEAALPTPLRWMMSTACDAMASVSLAGAGMPAGGAVMPRAPARQVNEKSVSLKSVEYETMILPYWLMLFWQSTSLAVRRASRSAGIRMATSSVMIA